MPDQDSVVRYAIYPGVGIARVGNARGPDAYFLGPEAPGEVPEPPGGFKDPAGAIKRQGARFRVYGLNAAGEAVREVTAADARIEWRVHLANRKAAWYQFLNAMDLGGFSQAALRRNGSQTGAARTELVIDPGPRTIEGRGVQGPRYQFDSGTFGAIPVPLGELRTDEAGRLIVLGGYGHAGGMTPAAQVTTFANNDGWYDDISDGPVRATVRIGDQSFEAEPAVVVVAPPNYGQGLYGVVTMYDLLLDLFGRELGWIELPRRPSFSRHVYPIFERLVQTQWVNQGFFFLFGQSSPSDLTAPAQLAVLADPGEASRPARQALFAWFRDPRLPRGAPQEPAEIPPFYGDAFGDFYDVAIDDLAVTVTQYLWLADWAAGDFDADWGRLPAPPARLAEVPLAGQPHALDRAALEDCLGGPFHPGIEITWIARVARMWQSPFRLHVLPEGELPSDDYGPVLYPEVALGEAGPLAASGPGTITRWMAVPWQTDASSCLSGYDVSSYLPLPSFWAARVPNQVLAQESYRRSLRPDLPTGQRLKHFGYRQFWLRDLGVSYQQRINAMITQWSTMGIVTRQAGVPDDPLLPPAMWVETDRGAKWSEHDASWEQVLIAEHAAPAAAPPPAIRGVSVELAAALAAMPVQRRRRVYGRGER